MRALHAEATAMARVGEEVAEALNEATGEPSTLVW
jgi:hypothetical protein